MSLTESERTDIRRFCGYPPAGAGLMAPFGVAEMDVRGTLEFRIGNLSPSERVIVRRYLGTLTVLELAVPRASENLDTEQAAVWTHNKQEVRDRLRLLDEWRRRLCQFLGVPPGSGLHAGSAALVI
jgi:hypothetical protein